METLVETLLQNLKSEFLSEHEKQNNAVQELIVEKNDVIRTLEDKVKSNLDEIKSLTTQVDDLTHECKNYENVSIHKNLAKQISEKDNEIRILNNRLSTFEKKYNTLKQKYDLVILKRDSEDAVSHKDASEEVASEAVEEDEEEDVEVEEVEEEDVEEDASEAVEEEVASEADASEADASEAEDTVTQEVASEAVEEDEEVIEVEFYEKRLKPKNGKGRVLFLITDDEQKDIYERLEDGEPGEHVGRLVGKNNKPHFF